MAKKKLSYYNYFLVLAMVLISGYYMTSLFYLNKTNFSGEQADLYGQITEEADAILKSAYRMESYAHGYMLTKGEDTYVKFKGLTCTFNRQFQELDELCRANDLAIAHLDKLDTLIRERLNHIQKLVKSDSLHHTNQQQHLDMIEQGGLLMDEISEVLFDIREAIAQQKEDNKKRALHSAENTLLLLTFFGLVMLIIVIYSFNKMRQEILINEKNAQEIAQFNIELRSMNENLESFAYVASHDLNEPLRKIRTFGDLISEELKNSTPDRELVLKHLERMQSSASRMQQLINDLLSYSRITGPIETFESVDLNTVINTVCLDLKFSIDQHKATFQIDELPIVSANASQMHQLFQNLISNAIKFHEPNRTPFIKISATSILGKEVNAMNVNLLAEGTYWKIDVADNGIGFSNDYLDKIFLIFQRLHGRSEYEGTGIGLSICKKICEQHRGDLSASGIEGEGATFSIFLPKD
ncbi:MAG: ATP-binding protein [Crocinitomicaceae bacterium]|nr:ATP-binding protein [Crocinitomicaceae bacterium]